MIHHELKGRQAHSPFFRNYTNAADRMAAADITSADIGKVALQLDDGSGWTLRSVAPLVWTPLVSLASLGLHVGGGGNSLATVALVDQRVTPVRNTANSALSKVNSLTGRVASLEGGRRVYEKGSHGTWRIDGTWTIGGLRPYQPFYIIPDGAGTILFRGSSGIIGGLSGNSKYDPSHVYVATSTTVSIAFSGISGTVRAYQ